LEVYVLKGSDYFTIKAEGRTVQVIKATYSAEVIAACKDQATASVLVTALRAGMLSSAPNGVPQYKGGR
jgi:hypothetical protein